MAIREAHTKYGVMLGELSGNTNVTAFKGIPFAKPPVGEYRWKAPRPLDVPDDPESIRMDCAKYADMSFQMKIPAGVGPYKEGFCTEATMNEDCLYLNVWTPAISADEKLPVMLWIHGGGYFAGSSYASNINADYYGGKGVILVSVAYRMSIMGFLAHSELTAESPYGASGNYGTLDQIEALKWVHDNISAFGGDPENITVFGQSAGSQSTQIVITSPLSRDVPKHAIMQSGVSMVGTDLIPMRTLKEAESLGAKLLELMGYASIDEARKADAEVVQEKSMAALSKLMPGGLLDLLFAPVVDGYVLEKTPGEYAISGETADIEVIIGHTEEWDMNFPMPMEAYDGWLSGFGDDRVQIEELLDIHNDEDMARKTPNSFRNNLFVASNAWGTKRQELGCKPTYYYHFRHPWPGDNSGAAHSSELFYAFNVLTNNWRPYTGADFEIAHAISNYWINFAKTGNPNGEGLPQWDAYDSKNPQLLEIKDGVSMQPVVLNEWQKWMATWASRSQMTK